MSLQSCPPSAANTILGICYSCEALYCSAYGCCAVECDVACCTTQHTAIATLIDTIVMVLMANHGINQNLKEN